MLGNTQPLREVNNLPKATRQVERLMKPMIGRYLRTVHPPALPRSLPTGRPLYLDSPSPNLESPRLHFNPPSIPSRVLPKPLNLSDLILSVIK